jgi:hypothetical protein
VTLKYVFDHQDTKALKICFLLLDFRVQKGLRQI